MNTLPEVLINMHFTPGAFQNLSEPIHSKHKPGNLILILNLVGCHDGK